MPNFSKYRIRPPLPNFSAFLKKHNDKFKGKKFGIKLIKDIKKCPLVLILVCFQNS